LNLTKLNLVAVFDRWSTTKVEFVEGADQRGRAMQIADGGEAVG
jgi:hypothetical protein